MAAITDDASYRRPQGDRPAALGTIWGAALGVAVVLLALVQVAVVQRGESQTQRIAAQLDRLEATLAKLEAATPDAAASNGLLAELGEQGRVAAAAESALERFARLERRLGRRIDEAEHAAASLDRLAGVTARVEQQSRLLAEAQAALAGVAADPGDLYAAIDRAGRVAPAIAEVDRLAGSLAAALANTQRLAQQSLRRVEGLSLAQEGLALRADRLASANKTVEGLLRLEARLNSPLTAVAASQARLDDLLRLKDAILAHTSDLPAAFETLEMIVALQRDYERAQSVFASVRRLMADLALLEPSVARAVALLQPVVDRTTIGRLAGSELRLVLQELRSRQSETVAELGRGNGESKVAGREAPTAAK